MADEVADPRGIVTQLYRLAAAGRGNLIQNTGFRTRYFSQGLLRAWRAADARNVKGEVGWLDFDPVSDSQDPSINGLRLTVESAAADKASVRASFRYAPDPKSTATQVVYDFVRENEQWKIDEIREGIAQGDGKPWSIRKMAEKAARARR
jgi:hypothetical protein